MPYHVLFFACLRSIHYGNHAIRERLRGYLHAMRAAQRSRRQVSRAVYLLEGIRSMHLAKHTRARVHAPGCAAAAAVPVITSFTCVILLFYLSLSDRW